MNEFKIFRALGLSFKYWFKNFIPFTLVAAVLYAPVVIYILKTDPAESNGLEAVLNTVFIRPIYFLIGISALLPPLLTYRVIQELNGTKVSIFTSIKFGLRGILPAAILAIIANLAQKIPMGGIFAAVLMCIWFVAAPAAVAEKLGPIRALGRSAELTAGRRWGIFGLTFMLGLALFGLMMLWIAPLFAGDRADFTPDTLKHTSLLLVATMGTFQMLNGVVQAVSYGLLRQDKEGVTHEELARVFD